MLSAIGDTPRPMVPTPRTCPLLPFRTTRAKLLTVNCFCQTECIQIVASGLPYSRPGAGLNWRRRNNEDSGFCRLVSGGGRRIGGRPTGAEAGRAGNSGRSEGPQGHVPDLVEGRPCDTTTGGYGLCRCREKLSAERPSDFRRNGRVKDEVENGSGRDHLHHEVSADDEESGGEKVGSTNDPAAPAAQATTLIPHPAWWGPRNAAAKFGGLTGPPLCTSALA